MIKIICVGKIKEDFYKDAIKEYLKRLSKYTKVEIIELEDLNYDVKKTIKEENDAILKILNKNDYNIALTPEGRELDSISFSKKIDETLVNNNITFIIGGSYGLNDLVKEYSNMQLSFSKLTFPHQLFRIILLEQIYRAFKIINNEKYHK